MNILIPNKLRHKVIPGILEKDWESIEKKIDIVKPFAKTIHIDLLDGIFAPNTTFTDPTPFKKYTNDLFFELHMMVEDPLHYLKPWAAVGFKRFIGHIEKMPDIAEFVAEGQLLGEVGLALDKQTAVEELHISYEDVDVMLVMTIQAGFSGQTLIPALLEKVRHIRNIAPSTPIEVDGGISETTILEAREAGANRFVANSSLFGVSSPSDQYHSFMDSIR